MRRIVVHGRVQGVGYRAACAREASRLGVSGTVRNLVDGTVEVVGVGDADRLDLLTRWCRRGPWAAEVSHVTVEDRDLDSSVLPFSGFRIL
jgi:acylphosphatase